MQNSHRGLAPLLARLGDNSPGMAAGGEMLRNSFSLAELLASNIKESLRDIIIQIHKRKGNLSHLPVSLLKIIRAPPFGEITTHSSSVSCIILNPSLSNSGRDNRLATPLRTNQTWRAPNSFPLLEAICILPPITDGVEPNLGLISTHQPLLQKCLSMAGTVIQI